MGNNIFKSIVTYAIILVLIVIAWKVLKFAIAVVLPIAIVVIIAYVIYSFVTKKR
jgi:hypothetical protein